MKYTYQCAVVGGIAGILFAVLIWMIYMFIKSTGKTTDQVRCVVTTEESRRPLAHPSKCFDCERENVYIYPSYGDPRLL